jgi:pSer/pThr/pTyr-binding forkhead associated (FHA) protein
MAAFSDALGDGLQGELAGPRLTLHVAGSPIVYRAGPGQTAVTVGRQRRKPGAPRDEGNDFVVRVADNEEMSLRISRRHVELLRTDTGWSVISRGSAGTEHNGQMLPSGVPVPLTPGDRLSLAGVLALFVEFDTVGGATVPLADLPAGESRAARLLLEATQGDLLNLD